MEQIRKGESVQAVYGRNVFEMNANAIYEWLRDCVKREEPFKFGWEQVHPDTAFKEVDEGKFGVICARRRDRKRSGHITVILPYAQQSQAGLQNLAKFGERHRAFRWYEGSQYDAWGAFIC